MTIMYSTKAKVSYKIVLNISNNYYYFNCGYIKSGYITIGFKSLNISGT